MVGVRPGWRRGWLAGSGLGWRLLGNLVIEHQEMCLHEEGKEDRNERVPREDFKNRTVLKPRQD